MKAASSAGDTRTHNSKNGGRSRTTYPHKKGAKPIMLYAGLCISFFNSVGLQNQFDRQHQALHRWADQDGNCNFAGLLYIKLNGMPRVVQKNE